MWDEKSDIRINALVEFLLVERIRFTQNNQAYSVFLNVLGTNDQSIGGSYTYHSSK